MRDRHGFILVFDITNPTSVDDLNDIYHQILRNKVGSDNAQSEDSLESAIPLVLVGNKLDLASERKVAGFKGRELATRWKCSYYETSAKMRTNVDELFFDLVGQMIKEETRQREIAEAEANRQQEKEDDDDDMVDSWCCAIS
jgi:GTPase SAR1 family protein